MRIRFTTFRPLSVNVMYRQCQNSFRTSTFTLNSCLLHRRPSNNLIATMCRLRLRQLLIDNVTHLARDLRDPLRITNQDHRLSFTRLYPIKVRKPRHKNNPPNMNAANRNNTIRRKKRNARCNKLKRDLITATRPRRRRNVRVRHHNNTNRL